MKRVCAIGHFGKGENLLNGQTIKTKIFTDQLIANYGEEEVFSVDTHGGLQKLLKLIVNVFYGVKECENIVIYPSDNGIKVIVPLLCVLNVFFHRSLHYIVIGGYIHEYLKRHSFLIKMLMKYSGIYVETEQMKQSLVAMGLKNVFVVPNCKNIPIVSKNEIFFKENSVFRFCTFSRVMKSKGIEDAVNAIEEINQEYGRTICRLDIYGQVDSNEEEWFNALLCRINRIDGVTYGGLIPYNQSVKILKDYYALLFPTYYEGEGFAGTLIDALAAGVPIIATDWHYNSSIVTHNQTGLIYGLNEKKGLRKSIAYAIDDQKKWYEMKYNCIAKATALKPSNVIKTIIDNMK